jgi:hypothetical protein
MKTLACTSRQHSIISWLTKPMFVSTCTLNPASVQFNDTKENRNEVLVT